MRTMCFTLAGLLLASSLEAQNNQALGTPGMISSIGVSPTKSVTGWPVTITVAGVSKCGSVKVYFGDDGSVTLTDVSFPRSVQHTYARTGTYTIKAVAGTNCNAVQNVQATLLVEGSAVTALCGRTGCDTRDACTTPVINKVIYVAPLEPADEFILSGSCFGAAPPRASGGVRLKGIFPTPGTSVPLEILTWSNTSVYARVPAMQGVRDQAAKLQLVSAGGASNEVPVSFRATRALGWIVGPATLHAVTGSCATTAANNACNSLFNETWGGSHSNPYSNTSVSGFDWVTISVSNGWVLEKYSELSIDFLEAIADAYNVQLMHLQPTKADGSGFIAGKTSGILRFPWALGPAMMTRYGVTVTVKGPKGVPIN